MQAGRHFRSAEEQLMVLEEKREQEARELGWAIGELDRATRSLERVTVAGHAMLRMLGRPR